MKIAIWQLTQTGEISLATVSGLEQIDGPFKLLGYITPEPEKPEPNPHMLSVMQEGVKMMKVIEEITDIATQRHNVGSMYLVGVRINQILELLHEEGYLETL